MKLTDRVAQIQPSQTMAITSLVASMRREGKDVIDLGAGEPDFDTPDLIKQAGIRAIEEGYTKYTPASGMFELKEAVCAKYKAEANLAIAPENVVITCGAKHAIANALLALCQQGDEVIIPAPYWTSYLEQVRFTGATPVILPTTEETGFKITPQQLADAVTPKTRMLLLNTPSNPTGAVYSEAEMDALVAVIGRNDFYILFDEIYEKMVYDGLEHINLARYAEIRDRVLTVNGVSKSYAMTGWRIGYLVAPEAIAKAVAKIQSHTTSNPSSISQKASIAAVQSDSSLLTEMIKAFDQRRTFLHRALTELPGMSCPLPQGAFYMFPNVSAFFGMRHDGGSIDSAMDFCSFLLQQAGVAVVPGEAFGSDQHIRISYATSMELLRESVSKIKEAVQTLR